MSSSRLSSATVFSPFTIRWTVSRLNSVLKTRRPSAFRRCSPMGPPVASYVPTVSSRNGEHSKDMKQYPTLADIPPVSAMDKVMLSLTNFASEMERERARQRTYDAMVRKAKALQVTGGKVYGYDNVDVISPETGKRVH